MGRAPLSHNGALGSYCPALLGFVLGSVDSIRKGANDETDNYAQGKSGSLRSGSSEDDRSLRRYHQADAKRRPRQKAHDVVEDETALDDESTSEAVFGFVDSVDTEWLNIGVIGYHEEEFILYDQPEASGVRLK